MHTTQAYPLSDRFLAASPPRSGILAYIRGFALTFWLFTMLFRLWWVRDWFVLQEMFASGFDTKEYFYYGFAVVIAGHLTLGPQAWISAPFVLLSDWTGRFVTAFFLLMLCAAPLSLVPVTSGMYAIATWVVVIVMLLFWTSNYRVLQRVLVISGAVLFAWLLVLFVKHGLTGGFAGQIGGINRNVTSTAALAAMILMLFSAKRTYRLAAFACAGFLVVSVTSRGSILAMGVFAVAYYTLNKGTIRAGIHAVLGLAVAGVVFLVFSSLKDLIFEDVFLLSNRARGIQSGFTGRFEMWEHALKVFWKRPLLGYGFRTSSLAIGSGFGGVHSAYIKILLEAGLIGTFFILAAAVIELFRRLRLSMKLRKARPNDLPGIDLIESFRINAIACASLCMLLTLWIYDQYYINLGSPISIVFFLMIVAPTFVTNQGVTLRRSDELSRRLALMS